MLDRSVQRIETKRNAEDVENIEEKIRILLTEGAGSFCDETNPNFHRPEDLPAFYDEEKFKRGQHFYYNNIFGLFFGKLLGLMTGLSIPSLIDILVFTQKSSAPLPVYRRYLSTIFHMCVWYDNGFKPGSLAWKSLPYVKSLHNSASKRSCAAGFKRIAQLDMALTQFAFMGFSIIRPQHIGIFNAKKEDLEAFIHVWRVIGHAIGMEDRFNICTGSFEETKQICEALLENRIAPEITKQDPKFLQMVDAFITGMWATNPVLETKVFLTYAYRIIYQNAENNNAIPQIELNRIQRYRYVFLDTWISSLKYNWFRVFNNWVQYLTLWLLRNFPFLAYYSYGYKNSHVSVTFLNSSKPSKS